MLEDTCVRGGYNKTRGQTRIVASVTGPLLTMCLPSYLSTYKHQKKNPSSASTVAGRGQNNRRKGYQEVNKNNKEWEKKTIKDKGESRKTRAGEQREIIKRERKKRGGNKYKSKQGAKKDTGNRKHRKHPD